MYRHLSCSIRLCLRNIPRPLENTSTIIQRRWLAFSLSVQHPVAPTSLADSQFDTIDEDALSQPETDSAAKPTSYREFMEKIGYKYQYAHPMSYLGETPFPMNPSYKPPPPISDAQKETIFRLYLSHRLENGPRRLAKRFNISLKRVNAIIRLKLFEKTFERQKRTLQTGFQVGMEHLLGATTHSSVPSLIETMVKTEMSLNEKLNIGIRLARNPLDPTHPTFEVPQVNALRSDVQKSDMLEQEEQRDASISHYERLYWESVQEDGREPLMPSILQTEKQKAQMRKLNSEVRVSKQFLVRKPQTEFIRRPKKQATFVVGRPRGRKGPVTKFLDVGGHFMDLDGRIKALAVSRQRAAKREKKAEELKQLYVKP